MVCISLAPDCLPLPLDRVFPWICHLLPLPQVIHRDLKLENILLQGVGIKSPKVFTFC